jgi:hypothetical protein
MHPTLCVAECYFHCVCLLFAISQLPLVQKMAAGAGGGGAARVPEVSARWLLSRAEVLTSPSAEDGIPWDLEVEHRHRTCVLVNELSQRVLRDRDAEYVGCTERGRGMWWRGRTRCCASCAARGGTWVSQRWRSCSASSRGSRSNDMQKTSVSWGRSQWSGYRRGREASCTASDVQLVAGACFFLACKLEETATDLRHIMDCLDFILCGRASNDPEKREKREAAFLLKEKVRFRRNPAPPLARSLLIARVCMCAGGPVHVGVRHCCSAPSRTH